MNNINQYKSVNHLALSWIDRRLFYKYVFYVILIVATTLSSCKKLISISEPRSTIIANQVFTTDAEATAAMSGVYYSLINQDVPAIFTGGMTIYSGLSSDELVLYDFSNSISLQFYKNMLLANNNSVYEHLWKPAFANLYHVNAVLEGLNNSKTLSDSVKNELVAEAKLVRAFINFNLVNLFGPIPNVSETDWRKNSLLNRRTEMEIYQNILHDLNDAELILPENYSVGKGQRIVPNKNVVRALLARVYLYLGDFGNAENAATHLINSSLYVLETSPNDVFKPNSSEAIWQLQQDNSAFSLNGTREGNVLIPIEFPGFALPPYAYISSSLFNSFEPNDLRKTFWLNSVSISGTNYYYPYKYKIGSLQAAPNGAYTEYYMVFRLAEQYLIRAEARAELNMLGDAVDDLNLIRRRASLLDYSGMINKESVLESIRHERKIELFAEWGHRWIDLKRWGIAVEQLTLSKGFSVATNSLLFPIPNGELQTNPNLVQNPGY